MPYKPRRWSPNNLIGRRASLGYSGGGGAAAAAAGGMDAPLSAVSSGDNMMPDPGFENIPGYNPETAVYPQNAPPIPQRDSGLLPPVSQGGAGRGMFSIGNAAHGTINLGGILGPRANPTFDPNNPTAGQMPYQTPGFFRRLFGDTGSDLNAAYVQNQNAQTLAQRENDANWARRTKFETDKQQAGFDQQWALEKARLDMDAARANLASSTQLKDEQLRQQGLTSRDAAERAAREEERYGEDPIVASLLKQEEAKSRVATAGVKPLGSGSFAMRDPVSGEMRYFIAEGGTPGGTVLNPDGSVQSTLPTPRRIVEVDINGIPLSGMGGNGTQQPPPPSANPDMLSPDELQLLQKAGGLTAPPANDTPTTVEPIHKRPRYRSGQPVGIPLPDWLQRLMSK